MARPDERAATRHAEHVGHPWWVWLLAVILVGSVGFAYLGFVGPGWSLVLMVALAALLAWWLWSSRVLVAVTDELFVAGPARLPLQFVGAVTPLDADEARRLSGVDADARAYLQLRGSTPTAVRVDVDDPADPTPYWLVSTSRPHDLAATLVAARAARLMQQD